MKICLNAFTCQDTLGHVVSSPLSTLLCPPPHPPTHNIYMRPLKGHETACLDPGSRLQAPHTHPQQSNSDLVVSRLQSDGASFSSADRTEVGVHVSHTHTSWLQFPPSPAGLASVPCNTGRLTGTACERRHGGVSHQVPAAAPPQPTFLSRGHSARSRGSRT